MAAVSAFLTVAYDGSTFHGFQRQPGLPTVQGELEEALAIALQRPIVVSGAGRTDAGVHARGQVVSFPAEDRELPEASALARSITALTPRSIAIREVRVASPSADARFSALGRRYTYRIAVGRTPPVLSSAMTWWIPRDLDVAAMRTAAALLVGHHDFKAFCVSASAREKSTMRSIDALSVDTADLVGEPVVAVTVAGRSFLHSMVRIIVGTLAEVGGGKRTVRDVADALASCQRARAGQTAPAAGLVLEEVSYPDGIWLRRGGSCCFVPEGADGQGHPNRARATRGPTSR